MQIRTNKNLRNQPKNKFKKLLLLYILKIDNGVLTVEGSTFSVLLHGIKQSGFSSTCPIVQGNRFIYIEDSALSLSCENVDIQNNNFSDGGDTSVILKNVSDGIIAGNNIVGNTRGTGLNIEASGNVQIMNNSIDTFVTMNMK